MSYNQIKYAICSWKCGSLSSHFSLPALFAILIPANPELYGGRRERRKNQSGGKKVQQYMQQLQFFN